MCVCVCVCACVGALTGTAGVLEALPTRYTYIHTDTRIGGSSQDTKKLVQPHASSATWIVVVVVVVLLLTRSRLFVDTYQKWRN